MNMKKKIFSLCFCAVFLCSLAVVGTPTVYAQAPEGSPVANHGQLSVRDGQLCDVSGNPYQLRGISSHGLHWYGQYVNQNAIRTIRDDWKANVFRLAMYTGESGYITNPQPIKATLEKGIQACLDLGMYVIIDWHMLGNDEPEDANPQTYQAQAIAFFDEMSKKYGHYPNVLYEICNEPNGDDVTWSNNIKPYAQTVIAAIRANDPDNLILVGSSTWSQDLHIQTADPLTESNIMYTVHFYAGTHGDYLQKRVENAVKAGFPVFISEWGTTRADGDGGIFPEKADVWLELLDKYNISWVNWSLSDKNEACALLKPGTSAQGNWNAQNLSASGDYVVRRLQSYPADEPAVTEPAVISSITCNNSDNICKGDNLTFRVQTTNGSGKHTLSYYLLRNGQICYKAQSVSSDSFSYTPHQAGDYSLLAYCRDEGKISSKRYVFKVK